MMPRTCWLAFAGVLLASSALASSVLGAQSESTSRSAASPGRGASGRATAPVPAARPQLEGQVRQAMTRAVRKQLGLDDKSMRELQKTDTKYEAQRRQLTRDERQARQTLKLTLEDSTGSDQAKIDQAMARMLQIQRQRVDLLEAEQKDLAAFLTPRQRAQYFSLRERVTRRLLELQQGSRGRRGGTVPPA